jgi:uncharacterized membrane protein
MSLLMSIGAFLPGLLGKQVSQKVAKVLGIITLGLLLIAVLSLGKCAYDASVIEQHESTDRAEKAEKQLEAERRADEEAAAQEAELAETKAELDAATAEAARRDPEGAAKPVGPVSQSYYDTLRQKEKRR